MTLPLADTVHNEHLGVLISLTLCGRDPSLKSSYIIMDCGSELYCGCGSEWACFSRIVAVLLFDCFFRNEVAEFGVRGQVQVFGWKFLMEI
ncbi:hypothetical protein Zmor_000311 [Zophobas morio]|uniref:Uncharacterized protein n=1 Tax=Zophobas morio TaxID=2755281 RepID=A0AA38IVZ5_9CUCU|nr:hypothetical protein Zmor_000311 [Zophobas morio]